MEKRKGIDMKKEHKMGGSNNSVKSTDTDSINCNPQITLRENKENEIVMEVSMSVNDTGFVPNIPKILPRLVPKKKRSVKKIEFLSSNFPINSWIHCVIQGNEIMVRNESNSIGTRYNGNENNDSNNIDNNNGNSNNNSSNNNTNKNNNNNVNNSNSNCSIGNKLLKVIEKTTISLYFDGELIRSESVTGGRPAVFPT